MARPSANLRLFVAAYPPRDLAAAWLAALRGAALPEHRLTPLEQIHLTMQFIGDVPVKALDAVMESVDRSCSGVASFTLSSRELIALPERGPSRLVALETDAPPALLELQRRLAARLATNVRANPSKAFRPHLTLCRFRAPSRLDGPLPGLSAGAAQPFTVERIALMRSTLRPQGAEHIEVAAFALQG